MTSTITTFFRKAYFPILLHTPTILPHTSPYSNYCYSIPQLEVVCRLMAHMSSATCMHTTAPLLARQRPHAHPFALAVGTNRQSLQRCRRAQAICCRAQLKTVSQKLSPAFLSSTALWMLSQLPAQAEGTDFSQGSFSKESYYVTLGLFVLSVPGVTS